MVSTALKNSTHHASAAAAAASNIFLALCSGPSPEAAQVLRMQFVFVHLRACFAIGVTIFFDRGTELFLGFVLI